MGSDLRAPSRNELPAGGAWWAPVVNGRGLGTMTPHPIDTMPADIAEEDRALLFCPEQGGWAYGGNR